MSGRMISFRAWFWYQNGKIWQMPCFPSTTVTKKMISGPSLYALLFIKVKIVVEFQGFCNKVQVCFKVSTELNWFSKCDFWTVRKKELC